MSSRQCIIPVLFTLAQMEINHRRQWNQSSGRSQPGTDISEERAEALGVLMGPEATDADLIKLLVAGLNS